MKLAFLESEETALLMQATGVVLGTHILTGEPIDIDYVVDMANEFGSDSAIFEEEVRSIQFYPDELLFEQVTSVLDTLPNPRDVFDALGIESYVLPASKAKH